MAKGSDGMKVKQRKDSAPKQKPTHARQIADMNEAQLELVMNKLEREVSSAEKAVKNASNTSSMQFFNDLMRQYPGGIGGNAKNEKYDRMSQRYDRDMGKLVEAEEKLKNKKELLDRVKKAYSQVKGTGRTQRTASLATANKGNGTWGKTKFTYLGKTVNAKRMGNLIAAKPFFTYNLYDANTGKQIKTFKSFKALDEYVRKQV